MITHVGTETGSVGNSEDVTVDVPSGVQDGDVLLGFYHNPDDDPLTVALSGFTQIALIGDATADDHKTGAWYRVASSEPSSYTFDSTGSGANQTSAMIMALRGVDTSNPLDVAFVQGSHYIKYTDSSGAPAAITTVTNGAWVVIFTSVPNSTTITDFSGPSGYTQRGEVIGNNRSAQVVTREIATAGAETPGSITLTGDTGTGDPASITLAIRPATGLNPAIRRRRWQ